MNGPEKSKPKDIGSMAKMSNDDEDITGIHNNQSIRSNNYGKPGGREKSSVIHQTMKPIYETMEEFFSRNCRKSLLEKKMAKDKTHCKYVGNYASSSHLDTESVFFESNLNENQTESQEECINVYDLANFIEPSDSELPPRRTFVKELTSKVSNLKEY